MKSRRRICLISTDFDGTLVEPDYGKAPDSEFFDILDKLRQREPVVWVINTGRDWNSLENELIERRFPIWPDWVVLVEREIHQIQHRRPVAWFEWNRKCELLHAQLFATVKPFWKKVEDFVRSQTGAQVVVDVGSPLGIIARNEQEADRISKFIEPLLEYWPNLVAVRNSIYFRFSHSFYNKGSCLQAVAREIGITPHETFAVGDHLNDLPMLSSEYARHLACPSNSVTEVKSRVASSGGFVAERPTTFGLIDALRHFSSEIT